MERRGRYASNILPVFLLFVFSGAAGLAYEVVWTRLLVRVFGASSFAVSTVLAAYMAGLALGSYLFGKMIDRKGNPILIYGLLELGVAVFALIFPLLLAALNPLYRGLYAGLEGNLYGLSLIRFLLCFTMLLVPTTLMGGTLPVLGRLVTGSLSNLTVRVGWLYSLNTFGAVAGCFLTGFVLLPGLGLRTTTLAAVAANLGIFAVCVVLARGGAKGQPAPAPPEPGAMPPADQGARATRAAGPRTGPIVLAAFLATGLAALAAEVLWTRVLALVVGTTVYAFSTMLTVYLLGLALGSAFFARIAQRTARPGLFFGLLVAAIGLAVFAGSVAFNHLPVLYMDLADSVGRTWQGSVELQFLVSVLIMIVPTFLMGGTFPLVARIYATDPGRVGARIGTAYAFNTVGSILGSFIGSFVLLEALGVEKGMLVIAVLYLVVGAVLLATVAEGLGRRARLAGAVAVAVAATAISVGGPSWDRMLMTSGVYVYGSNYGSGQGVRDALKFKQLLFYDEGPGATVSVERNQSVLSLKIDGKVDASDGSDMITQEMIPHLPMLLHPGPDTVLVIGLGAGVSLGSTERYPVAHVDCVELLGEVISAAGLFKESTHDCLSDPRLNVILGDGRNHVLLSGKKYDVIVSEPTNVWISGVGDLFTLEFFRLARARLKPGGTMSAWFHTYHMGEAEFRSAARTFLEVFPHATLWQPNESDVIFVATLEPTVIDGGLLARLESPEVAGDLRRVGINRPADLLAALVMDETGLAAYARGARLHTDDNMLLEFQAGRRVVEATHGVHIASFLEHSRPIRFTGLDDETNAQTARQVEARRLAMRGTLEQLAGRAAPAMGYYDRAYAVDPGDPYVVSAYFGANYRAGDALLAEGKHEEAIGFYEKALGAPIASEVWAAYDGLAMAHLALGRADAARDAFELAVGLNPYGSMSYLRLADSYLALGDTVRAVPAYDKAFVLGAWNLEAANNAAWLRAVRGEDLDRALEIALALTRGSREPNHFDTLGWVYYRRGEYRAAAKALERAVDLGPGQVQSVYHLALVRRAEGDGAAAQRLLRQVVEMDRGGRFGLEAAGALGE